MKESQTIVLAGRRFRLVGEHTLDQDIHFLGLFSQAGLETVEQLEAETVEQFGWRILSKVLEAGVLTQLIACLVIPEELAPAGRIRRFFERANIVARAERPDGWTPALAAATASWLGGLTDPIEKGQVYSLVSELLLPFVCGATRPSLALILSSPTKKRGKAAPPLGRFSVAASAAGTT